MIYYSLSFGIDVPFLYLLVIITLISVITMIPVSLNGLGVREALDMSFSFKALGFRMESPYPFLCCFSSSLRFQV